MSGRKSAGELFSSRSVKGNLGHSLSFVVLSENLQFYDLAVDWLFDMLKHMGSCTREGLYARLEKVQDVLYLGLLNGQPVAMFGLKDYELDTQLKKYLPTPKWLFAVYVDKPYRGMGFFKQIMNEAKQKLLALNAGMALFDVILPKRLAIYERAGAKVVQRESVAWLALELSEDENKPTPICRRFIADRNSFLFKTDLEETKKRADNSAPVSRALVNKKPEAPSRATARKRLLIGAGLFLLAGLLVQKKGAVRPGVNIKP